MADEPTPPPPDAGGGRDPARRALRLRRAVDTHAGNGRGRLPRRSGKTRYAHPHAQRAAREHIRQKRNPLFVVNRESYAIQIDRAQCRGEAFAQAVCRLASILEETGDAPADTLPVSRTEPFAFTEENCFDPGSDTARLKDALGLDGGASPRQVLAALAGDAACAETPAPATRARRPRIMRLKSRTSPPSTPMCSRAACPWNRWSASRRARRRPACRPLWRPSREHAQPGTRLPCARPGRQHFRRGLREPEKPRLFHKRTASAYRAWRAKTKIGCAGRRASGSSGWTRTAALWMRTTQSRSSRETTCT